jgi:hypothetical protein
MRRSTTAAFALLAVGLAIGGCGSDASETASATAPAEGRYLGETSQGLPISFVVTGTTVREVRFGWRAKCEDGRVHANTIALPGGGIHYGVFSTGGGLETGGIAQVAGRFDGEQASGELSRSRGSAFGTDCRATGVGWSADLIEPAATGSVS